MKKLKLFKTLLIPSLGVLTLGTIATVATGCGGDKPTPVVHVTEVELNEESISLIEGDTTVLAVTVSPDDATNKDLNWESDNEKVATVDADGVVRGNAQGTATITVSSVDNPEAYDQCTVNVTAVIHVESVSLDKHNLSLEVGGNDYLTATVLPADATDPSVSWASDNKTVATIDENGQVTAVSVGTANITVTTRDGGKTDTCAVTVEPIHVESVSLDKDNLSLVVGDNDCLTATVSPTDATDPSVSWASDNETVATVDANGTINAVGVGNATIIVTTNDGHYTDTCDVAVTLPYVCVEANADSTLGLHHDGGNNPNLQYSIDGGASWNAYFAVISISQGQTLLLKGNNPEGWSHSGEVSKFVITGDVSISGNVMGLLDNGATSGEEGDITAIPCDYCFCDLFRDSTGITSVSDDFLPAIVLKNNCYDGMFYECESLIKSPHLPATSLAESCYNYMFNGCSSLTAAPELPAETLAVDCYNCMFNGCSSLTAAPNLPATSLVDGCYWDMFNGCSSLTSIRISYTGDYYLTNFDWWVSGVASSGIFYYKGTDSLANFGFPDGWSINPD